MCLSIGFTKREGCPFPKEISAWKVFEEKPRGVYRTFAKAFKRYRIGKSYRASESDVQEFEGLTDYFDYPFGHYQSKQIFPKYHLYFHAFLSKVAGETAIVSWKAIEGSSSSNYILLPVLFQEIEAIGQQDFFLPAWGPLPCVVAKRMTILEPK